MTHITIDNKKYVIIPEENYQELKKNAALKWNPEKTFFVEEEYPKDIDMQRPGKKISGV